MIRELALERVGTVTRLAVIEDGKLCEFYSAYGEKGALSGNIYLGRVMNVIGGMNAAFVDIGLKKNAYLPLEKNGETVRSGQLIICRVDKEPGGSKGPRITREISLPGRLCAVLPGITYAGVSKKIENEETRDRLYETAKALTEAHGIGIIVRTAAENESSENLRNDYLQTVEQWKKIENMARYAKDVCLLHSDGDLALFAARELMNDDTARVRTDDRELYEALRSAFGAYCGEYTDRIELRTGGVPLFDVLRIDHQLNNALARVVRLKSGGSLVFDETEAMTVIDVNTAQYTGKRSLEETILKIDLEAAEEIARQLRLREIGGIIMIDFIDLTRAEDRELVLERLRTCVAGDHSRTHVVDMTALGIAEVTRKKVYQSLSKRMTRTCGSCRGEGRVVKNEEIALRCARELKRRRNAGDTTGYTIKAAEAVAEVFARMFGGTFSDITFDIVPDARDLEILPTDF